MDLFLFYQKKANNSGIGWNRKGWNRKGWNRKGWNGIELKL